MLSLQGPESRRILLALIAEAASAGQSGRMNPSPSPDATTSARRSSAVFPSPSPAPADTGDPLGFEFFLPSSEAGRFWDRLLALGAAPIGLGARDTLRLEAALPLYGHELGTDPEGREIPIFASPLSRFAVSFSALKGRFHRPRLAGAAVRGVSEHRDGTTGAGSRRRAAPHRETHQPARPGDRPPGGGDLPGSGRRRLRLGAPGRVDHQRHHGAVLGVHGRGSLLRPQRAHGQARRRPRPPGQLSGGTAGGGDRRPRPAHPGTRGAVPPALGGAALCPAHPVGSVGHSGSGASAAG